MEHISDLARLRQLIEVDNVFRDTAPANERLNELAEQLSTLVRFNDVLLWLVHTCLFG